MLNNKIESAQAIIDIIYPVGSIYMSVNSASPQILFGGNWEQIEDTFLLAAGSTYTAGDTGGSATHTPAGTLSGGAVGNHTLTVAEIPSHKHEEILLNGDSNWYLGGANWNSNARSRHPLFSNSIGATTTTFAFNSSNTGGDGAHNHPFTQPTFTGTSQDTMPPYLTVYIWKRVS